MPQKPVQKVMESYVPPTDRNKQLTLAERDPTTLTKAQKKRLRKKLKQKGQSIDVVAEEEAKDEDHSNENGDGSLENGQPTMASEEAEEQAEQAEEPTEEVKDDAANAEPEDDTTHKPSRRKGSEKDSKDLSPKKPRPEEDAETLEDSIQRYKHVKLVDFGNGCWTHKHFTEDIQTRQYRSPEVICRNSYHTSADVWSCACLVFELLTGDFLFDPQESEYIDRDEDHLALIVELLQTQQQVPACLYAKGANAYINSQGLLRHINHLKFWDLKSVLQQKYKFRKDKAAEIASFLLPMLAIDPQKRASAQHALTHPWLQPVPSDWEPYLTGDGSPKPAAAPGEPDDDDWEEDEDTDEESEIELPPGMTLEMYRSYVQQQMQLLQLAEEAQDLPLQLVSGDHDSEGPGTPVTQSPTSSEPPPPPAAADGASLVAPEAPAAECASPPMRDSAPADSAPTEEAGAEEAVAGTDIPDPKEG